MRVHIIVPGSIHDLTGGYIYDRYIIHGLREKDVDVQLHQLAGEFPHPHEENISEYSRILSDLPDNEIVVVDCLAAGLMNDTIQEHFSRLKMIALVHLPLGVTPWDTGMLDPSLFKPERTTLRSSRAVVVTGVTFRDSLLPYDIPQEKIFVIEPGWDPTARKETYSELPRRLLCVANVIQRKGYLELLEALSQLKEFRWELISCGSTEQETDYTRYLRERIDDWELGERVVMKGPIAGCELESEFLRADLFVFPSLYETYGMALIEAAGYGLPIVTSIESTVNRAITDAAAIFFEPGDSERLKEILYALMSSTDKYANLCGLARRQQPNAHSWGLCAERFLEIITRIDES